MNEGRLSVVVNRVVNVLTVFAAIVLVGSIVRRWTDVGTAPATSGLPVGAEVALEGFDWHGHQQTLVFCLQVGCSHCEASAGFYKDLLASNRGSAFYALAAVPGPAAAAKTDFTARGLSFADVRTADFETLRVAGTPTLLLVGPDGRLKASWMGRLGPADETAVFERLGIARYSRTAAASRARERERAPVWLSIGPADVARDYRQMVVVDIREREEFRAAHIATAANIPIDEIEARAAHEIPADVPILVYCRETASCTATQASAGVTGACGLGVRALDQLGFTDVRVTSSDLAQLEGASVKLERSDR